MAIILKVLKVIFLNRDVKLFIEKNFDYLVELYNRYIKFCLRKSTPIEYYASPYMNLVGYPSNDFINFCTIVYNKRNRTNYLTIEKNYHFIHSFFAYGKLLFLFLFGSLFFEKKLQSNSVIIHGFHSDTNFQFSPYRTIKSPPLDAFQDKNIYHDINLSFISLKSLHKYRKNSVISSLRFLTIKTFIKLHFIAMKIYFQNKKIKVFAIQFSYVTILYNLVKGYATAELINNMKENSVYLHMWENRGHQLITDYLVTNRKNLFFLDLGITFRLAPEYTMFYYQKHYFQSTILFMSKYNFDLTRTHFKSLHYDFFKNYRIDCENKSAPLNDNILVVSPLSEEVNAMLYNLVKENQEKKIKIKMHPYLKTDKYDKKFLEEKNLNDLFYDYGTVIYAGVTTASLELYFQEKKVYKFENDYFLNIDPLIDNNRVESIYTLDTILESHERTVINEQFKEYMFGCKNRSLESILKENMR